MKVHQIQGSLIVLVLTYGIGVALADCPAIPKRCGYTSDEAINWGPIAVGNKFKLPQARGGAVGEIVGLHLSASNGCPFVSVRVKQLKGWLYLHEITPLDCASIVNRTTRAIRPAAGTILDEESRRALWQKELQENLLIDGTKEAALVVAQRSGGWSVLGYRGDGRWKLLLLDAALRAGEEGPTLIVDEAQPDDEALNDLHEFLDRIDAALVRPRLFELVERLRGGPEKTVSVQVRDDRLRVFLPVGKGRRYVLETATGVVGPIELPEDLSSRQMDALLVALQDGGIEDADQVKVLGGSIPLALVYPGKGHAVPVRRVLHWRDDSWASKADDPLHIWPEDEDPGPDYRDRLEASHRVGKPFPRTEAKTSASVAVWPDSGEMLAYVPGRKPISIVNAGERMSKAALEAVFEAQPVWNDISTIERAKCPDQDRWILRLRDKPDEFIGPAGRTVLPELVADAEVVGKLVCVLNGSEKPPFLVRKAKEERWIIDYGRASGRVLIELSPEGLRRRAYNASGAPANDASHLALAGHLLSVDSEKAWDVNVADGFWFLEPPAAGAGRAVLRESDGRIQPGLPWRTAAAAPNEAIEGYVKLLVKLFDTPIGKLKSAESPNFVVWADLNDGLIEGRVFENSRFKDFKLHRCSMLRERAFREVLSQVPNLVTGYCAGSQVWWRDAKSGAGSTIVASDGSRVSGLPETHSEILNIVGNWQGEFRGDSVEYLRREEDHRFLYRPKKSTEETPVAKVWNAKSSFILHLAPNANFPAKHVARWTFDLLAMTPPAEVILRSKPVTYAEGLRSGSVELFGACAQPVEGTSKQSFALRRWHPGRVDNLPTGLLMKWLRSRRCSDLELSPAGWLVYGELGLVWGRYKDSEARLISIRGQNKEEVHLILGRLDLAGALIASGTKKQWPIRQVHAATASALNGNAYVAVRTAEQRLWLGCTGPRCSQAFPSGARELSLDAPSKLDPGEVVKQAAEKFAPRVGGPDLGEVAVFGDSGALVLAGTGQWVHVSKCQGKDGRCPVTEIREGIKDDDHSKARRVATYVNQNSSALSRYLESEGQELFIDVDRRKIFSPASGKLDSLGKWPEDVLLPGVPKNTESAVVERFVFSYASNRKLPWPASREKLLWRPKEQELMVLGRAGALVSAKSITAVGHVYGEKPSMTALAQCLSKRKGSFDQALITYGSVMLLSGKWVSFCRGSFRSWSKRITFEGTSQRGWRTAIRKGVRAFFGNKHWHKCGNRLEDIQLLGNGRLDAFLPRCTFSTLQIDREDGKQVGPMYRGNFAATAATYLKTFRDNRHVCGENTSPTRIRGRRRLPQSSGVKTEFLGSPETCH